MPPLHGRSVKEFADLFKSAGHHVSQLVPPLCNTLEAFVMTLLKKKKKKTTLEFPILPLQGLLWEKPGAKAHMSFKQHLN
jgi:hypothetical protein